MVPAQHRHTPQPKPLWKIKGLGISPENQRTQVSRVQWKSKINMEPVPMLSRPDLSLPAEQRLDNDRPSPSPCLVRCNTTHKE